MEIQDYPVIQFATFEAQVYNLRVGTARGSPKWEIPVHIGELCDYRETYSKYVVDRAIRGSADMFVHACTDFDDRILPRGRFVRPLNVQCPACSSGEGLYRGRRLHARAAGAKP